MQLLNVVIAQDDCTRAEQVAIALHPHFRNVSVARDAAELRRTTIRNRPTVAVIDLELISIQELAVYCRDFPTVAVVCTHRIPDDTMWTQSLAAGAIDCCHTLDVRMIVEAAHRNIKLTHAKAA